MNNCVEILHPYFCKNYPILRIYCTFEELIAIAATPVAHSPHSVTRDSPKRPLGARTYSVLVQGSFVCRWTRRWWRNPRFLRIRRTCVWGGVFRFPRRSSVCSSPLRSRFLCAGGGGAGVPANGGGERGGPLPLQHPRRRRVCSSIFLNARRRICFTDICVDHRPLPSFSFIFLFTIFLLNHPSV